MAFAPPAAPHGQSSTRSPITLEYATKPITGPTRLKRRDFGRREKRGRSHLAPRVAVHSLAQLGSISCTPCLAREKLRHEALFREDVVTRRRHPSPVSSRSHAPCTRVSLKKNETALTRNPFAGRTENEDGYRRRRNVLVEAGGGAAGLRTFPRAMSAISQTLHLPPLHTDLWFDRPAS